AEEIVFNDITSGAANDLERVTRLARTMVTRLGMSTDLGPLVYGQKEELIFLGREISEQRDYSETVAERIDTAVRALVEEAYSRARRILNEYRSQLDSIARRLIEVETLDSEEFARIFGQPVEPKVSGTPIPMPQATPA
ncbi:MAG TPA: cell division protein FtsH, partial [Anaerolineales bacterium]|nr:cell division protein FtsH [Anaerolineales bacterium]